VHAPVRIHAALRDNAAMPLKLFRTTGYSTLLMPGETRLAPHPARLVVWGSLWLALACNVALWRAPAGSLHDWRAALAWAAIVGGTAGVVLSLLGWRRTLKFTLTVALVAGALIACGLWTQQLPVDTLWHGSPRTWLPAWASFLRWQVPALVLVLAVLPVVVLWNTPVRRLSGPAQLRANLTGAAIAAVILAAGIFLIA
jgi:lipid A ethanolaminephosphotransferase